MTEGSAPSSSTSMSNELVCIIHQVENGIQDENDALSSPLLSSLSLSLLSSSSSLPSSSSMLECWNDDIEKSFLKKKERYQVSTKLSSATGTNKTNNNNSSSSSSNTRSSNSNNSSLAASDTNNQENEIISIEETANELHAIIFKVVSILYTPESDMEKEKEVEEKRDNTNNDDSSPYSKKSISKTISNDEANELTLRLAEKIEWNYTAHREKNDEISNNNTIPTNDIVIQLLSNLIRASINVIRWNRNLLSKARFTRRRNKHNNNSDDIVVDDDKADIHGLDSCHRLCSTGMVKLYLILLNIYSQSSQSSQLSQQQQQQQENTKLELDTFHSRCIQDELAKNSCIALFHSTYDGGAIIGGGGGPQSITGEPICKKSLREFTSQTSLIYGIPTIARLLTSATSVQVMLVLIKYVHNLVGSVPHIMNRIDLELADLFQSSTRTVTSHDVEPNLISILVSTMAWCIRSKPPFPGKRVTTTTPIATNTSKNDDTTNHTHNHKNKYNLDRRAEIVIESIRVLFALQNVQNAAYKKVNNKHPTIMTQLGIIIVDILHLPNNDERVYEVKVSVIMLLMDLPKEFSSFLLLNHCIEPLVLILWIQLNQVVVEGEGMAQGQSRAVSLLPILILLNKLSQANSEIKNKIKTEIFPLSPPGTDEGGMRTGIEINTDEDVAKGKNINPVDAPPGTTRWKLIKLMTWTESNVKRCSSELLWTLCNGDSKEFVRRTGFGNAVHMLGIRGLVNIPTSNSVPTSNK